MIAMFLCLVASATDGDTLRCSDDTRVRIAGIDAPEMPGHCARNRQCTPGDPFASRRSLIELTQGKTLICKSVGKSYARVLAHCSINGTSIGCTQVRRGYAVLRYSEKARVCG
jgi:endonuclease YncB( thermonuclease family)